MKHNALGQVGISAPLRVAAVLAAALAFAAPAMQAGAAEPTFPVGLRIGLVPPPGMVTNESFPGFADPDKNAAILIAALPAAGYSQIETMLAAGALKKQGVTIDKREPITLGFGQGVLLTGRQVADKEHFRKWILVAAASDLTALVTVQIPEQENAYSDAAVRAALATLSIRPSVPAKEQLSLLPFTVGELAGFHIDGVLRGRALMLSDASGANSAAPNSSATAPSAADSSAAGSRAAPSPGDGSSEPDAAQEKSGQEKAGANAGQANPDRRRADGAKPADASSGSPPAPAPNAGVTAHLMVAAMPGGPAEPDQRAEFARLAFNDITGIKDVHLTMSEPLRMGGQPGYQTFAEAKDARSGTNVMVVQWLRFGSGGFLQMIGVAPADDWTAVLSRLRTVRDSVDPK